MTLTMAKNEIAYWLALMGSLCWVVCFWWMHRVSSKQNSLLDQLHMQGKRIEKLSKIEHDLIKEVHPQVAEIREGLDAMITAVKDNTEQITLASTIPPDTNSPDRSNDSFKGYPPKADY
jgi:phosphoserine phosphatase